MIEDKSDLNTRIAVAKAKHAYACTIVANVFRGFGVNSTKGIKSSDCLELSTISATAVDKPSNR